MFRFFTVNILLLILCAILLNPSSVLAKPDIITDRAATPISPDQGLFYVYFHYGDPTQDKPIANKSLSLTIQGSQFKIAKQNVYDLFDDGLALISCNESYSGKEYQISPKIISDRAISNYGPRSKNAHYSTLQPRYTGCLKVGLQVTGNKTQNLNNQIIFDEDANQSISYKVGENPGKQILQLYLGKKTSCEYGQSIFEGKCVSTCINGNARDSDGKCSQSSSVCKIGEENVQGKCLTICPAGRKSDGDCKEQKISTSNQVIN